MKAVCLAGLLILPSLLAVTAADPAPTPPASQPANQPAATPPLQVEQHGFGHKVLLYIPNRIFDVLDIVRARVRLGPGLALGARVTKYTDLFLGAYKSVYIGLPGPRDIPRIPWPGGIESRSGLAASVADGTVTTYDSNPRYATTEIGAGVHGILVGAEVGVDPAEVFDFAFGLLFIDFCKDDL